MKVTINTINILSISVDRGIVSMLPANRSRYIGKSTTCRIKLIGRTEVERDTFPFAMPVNARCQSVQGVTISIMKPIHKAGSSDKKIAPNLQANTDLHIKLMIVLDSRNLIFKYAFLIGAMESSKTIHRALGIRMTRPAFLHIVQLHLIVP